METLFNSNLLSRLENISRASLKCKLDMPKLTAADDDISAISSFLGITLIQSVLFAVIADLSLQRTVTLDNLSKHFSCSVLRLVTFMKEMEHLEKRGLIKRSLRRKGHRPSYNDIGYSVPAFVIDALLKEDPSKLETASRFDLSSFLKQIS